MPYFVFSLYRKIILLYIRKIHSPMTNFDGICTILAFFSPSDLYLCIFLTVLRILPNFILANLPNFLCKMTDKCFFLLWKIKCGLCKLHKNGWLVWNLSICRQPTCLCIMQSIEAGRLVPRSVCNVEAGRLAGAFGRLAPTYLPVFPANLPAFVPSIYNAQ